ncbi:MAG: hypothetical protein RLZZ419_2149 [Pseudomonadota bacterium]|jgi:hypothetical protein
MNIIFGINRLSLVLSLLLLTGCAQFTSDWAGNLGRYEDPYAQSDFDGLFGFDANMAKMPLSSRSEVCDILLKRQKSYPAVGIQLRLMIGRLFSDACGNITDILDGVSAIPSGSLSDARVQNLVAIHTEALRRLQVVSRKPLPLECKQKTVKPASASGSKNEKGVRSDENRLLREKLEAIRSMEKHLDESGEVK